MGAVATLRGYLQLSRVSNLPTVWTNVLAGCLLSGGRVSAGVYPLLAASLSFFYLAGMSLNDLWDSEYDSLHKPSRPIPSGRIRSREALVFTIALFVAGFIGLTLAPNEKGAVAATLLLVFIVLYDRHHKQNALSVLLMASCRFLVFVVAAFAINGRLGAPVVVAATIQSVYIVSLSLVARYEDSRQAPFSFPVMPLLLAGISLVDGLVLALMVGPVWIMAGSGGFLLTLVGQRYVRGD